jgi:hypothetical protein
MYASQQIGDYIRGIDGWRGEMLSRLRELVLEAEPDLSEEWKWNSPVWSKAGMVCSASAFKDHVAVNFFQGASLPDPNALFNSGLDAKTSRSIRLGQGDALDEDAFRQLVRAAIDHNAAKGRK